MNPQFQKTILRAGGATRLAGEEKIQTLWGGYGRLLRIRLQGGKRDSVVVKHVSFPSRTKASDLSHQRKAKSYRVETAWYQRWSPSCDEACRVPRCLAVATHGDEVLLVLEDLDEAGFGGGGNTSTRRSWLWGCAGWRISMPPSWVNSRTSYGRPAPIGISARDRMNWQHWMILT